MSADPLHTRLCEEYGCEVPIVAFAHTKDVIVAVVNAGGIGVLGGIAMTPDQLRSDIQWIRDRVGDKAFGIDLVILEPVRLHGLKRPVSDLQREVRPSNVLSFKRRQYLRREVQTGRRCGDRTWMTRINRLIPLRVTLVRLAPPDVGR